jgi:hypothetical protein
MDIVSMINDLAGNWFFIGFCVCMVAYFIFQTVRNIKRRAQLKDERVRLEKEMTALEAEYQGKFKELEKARADRMALLKKKG